MAVDGYRVMFFDQFFGGREVEGHNVTEYNTMTFSRLQRKNGAHLARPEEFAVDLPVFHGNFRIKTHSCIRKAERSGLGHFGFR